MKTKILVCFVTLLAALLFVKPNTALANEGDVVLRNIVGGDAECQAKSVWISNQLNVLTICADISYPAGTYVVWAQPSDGGNPVRLGDLSFGRVLLKTSTQFSSLFVTLENEVRPRTPNSNVIMRGNLIPFRFDSSTSPASLDSNGDVPNELLVDASPSPTPEPASSGGLFRILAIGGVLAFLALFGIILVVFVITRR